MVDVQALKKLNFSVEEIGDFYVIKSPTGWINARIPKHEKHAFI